MTMPDQPATPRRFRLQFSLRGLLVLMVLVGVGLVIYRWPWEEEEKLRQSAFPYSTSVGEADWIREELMSNQAGSPVHALHLALSFNTGDVPIVEYRKVSTYCRAWNGKPVKHGVE